MTAINSSIENSVFLVNAKVVTIAPLEKEKRIKNDILNFRSVSLLNIISKFYKILIKDQLSISKYLSPMIFIGQKSYSTLHVKK